MKIGWIIGLLGILLCIACKKPLGIDDIDQLAPLIKMYKSPCFGQCPVFTLIVYENGLTTFDGQRNTSKKGLHYKKLSKEALRQLHNRFKTAQLEQYEDYYPSDLADLPKVSISYYEKQKVKTIKGDINRPPAIKELEQALDTLAMSNDWTAKTPQEEPLADYIIPEEIIIQFAAQTDIPIWVERFADVDLALKERIAPNSNMWVITYDTDKIAPKAMLERVRQSDGVQLAEFNKRLSGRK
ncbi:MAG: DUF6438 domain-containing protein [Bacteroidota bacterium]